MYKKQFDKKYVGKNIAVHCKTEALANEFLDMADRFGYKFVVPAYENYYYKYTKNTYYNIDENFISFGSIEINSFSKDIVEFNGFSIHNEYKLIVNENKKTVLLIDKFDNKGKAKCCNADEFNLGFGVELAKARLDGDKDKAERLLEKSNNKNKSKFTLDVKVDSEKLESDVRNAIYEAVKGCLTIE